MAGASAGGEQPGQEAPTPISSGGRAPTAVADLAGDHHADHRGDQEAR